MGLGGAGRDLSDEEKGPTYLKGKSKGKGEKA